MTETEPARSVSHSGASDADMLVGQPARANIVLFVCRRNAGASQMVAAFFKWPCGSRASGRSLRRGRSGSERGSQRRRGHGGDRRRSVEGAASEVDAGDVPRSRIGRHAWTCWRRDAGFSLRTARQLGVDRAPRQGASVRPAVARRDLPPRGGAGRSGGLAQAGPTQGRDFGNL